MKRLIASVLALVLCFGLLAGCGTDEPQASTPVAEPTETQPVETTPVQEEPDTAAEDVKSAAAYLKAMYKESEAATPYDIARLAVVRVAHVPYTVVWSAEDAAVTATDNGDGTVTINVDEGVTEETKYVLPATVSDEAGNTASVSFDHYIPASLGDAAEILEMAYALEQGAALEVPVTLTGVITAIDTPYDAGYKNVSVVMAVEGHEDKPVLCYRLKGEGAENLFPGDTITVSGIIKNYKGTIEFDAGCTMDSWENTGADVPLLLTADEILDYAKKNLKDGETMQGTYSLSGRVQKVDSAYDPMYGHETLTLRVPLANNKYQDVLCYRIFTGAKNIEAGDYVTIRGSLMKYKGAVQFGSGSFTTKYDPTTLAEALAEASKLKNGQYLSYTESVTGTVKINTAYSSQYKNITFTVTDAEGNNVYCYRGKGEGMDTLKNGDTVTVSGNLTAYNGKAQFDSKAKVTVVKDPVTPPVTPEQPQQPFPATLAEQIEAAKKLGNGEYLNGNSTLTGVVEIKEAYTTQYKNVSIWVTNSDGVKLQAHRVKGFAGIETLANGDTVTVTGPLTAYNGTAQFDYMSTVTIVSKAPTTDPDEPVTPPVTPDPDEPATEKTVTYTFSFGGTGGTTATAAGLKTAFTTSDLAVESVSGISKAYQGYKKQNASDGAGFEGTNFLKTGSSNANGTMTLTFPSNVKISKVVVNAHGWKSGASDKLTVNGIQKTASGSGTPTDLVFELSTPSNVLSFTCAKRCFIFSVTVTYTEG